MSLQHRRVNEAIVRAVPQPAFTDTWHPIGHDKLLNSMYQTVDSLGAEVVKTNYTLSDDGLNLFGTWQLSETYKGSPLMVGFRNSLKKMFAVGFCAGRFVIACENMQFGGDFVEFRKHTSGLDFNELLRVCSHSFREIKHLMTRFADWHEDLRYDQLPENEAKILTYDCMNAGVFPPSKFKAFVEHYKEEAKLYGENLYSFYGGVTRLVRENSLFSIQETTRSLNILIREYKLYIQ